MTCPQSGAGASTGDPRLPYGPQIAAIAGNVYVGQFLSRRRVAQALAELFGTWVS
jgi:hypothetical protein